MRPRVSRFNFGCCSACARPVHRSSSILDEIPRRRSARHRWFEADATALANRASRHATRARHASRCSRQPDVGLVGMTDFRADLALVFSPGGHGGAGGQARGALWGAIDFGNVRRPTASRGASRPSFGAQWQRLMTDGNTVRLPYKQEGPGSSPGPPIHELPVNKPGQLRAPSLRERLKVPRSHQESLHSLNPAPPRHRSGVTERQS